MNCRLILVLLTCLISTLFMSPLSAQDVRLNYLFNFGWKFKHGAVQDAHKVEFNDTDWRELNLPHDFQFEQPWDRSGGGARGYKVMSEGWYRKTFMTDPAWKGQRVLLDFEGIMLCGDVYLNGQKVGKTDYGYLGFEVDVTDQLSEGGDNVVAVYANTGKRNGSRWYTGGGLYRDVHLVVKNPVSVARHGVFVSTPHITKDQAFVRVQVEIDGFQGKTDDLVLIAKVFSPNGDLVGTSRTNAPKRSKKQTEEVVLPLIDVANPMLWACETPHLYQAEITLSLNGTIVDKVTERFGIRTIEFTQASGFLLNGKKVFLKGISNHQDLGALGVAAYEAAIARQMDVLKSYGFNHIRTSHNPYSPSFLRLADEKGLLIVDELYDKWSNDKYWGGRTPWSEQVFHNLPEWIKRDRNHPSVILWSLGNELQMREDLIGFPTGDWGVTTYRMLDVLAKRYDPTRKTTVAMHPSRANGLSRQDSGFTTTLTPPELATITDVASFNYRWNDYAAYLKYAPHMIIYQSEAASYELAAPYFGMDKEKMVGVAFWGAIEYWGESNGWPRKGWAYSFFNHALQPYPQAYLLKSAFMDEPLVHIGVVDNSDESMEWNDVVVGRKVLSSHWNREKGKKYNLFTFTNAEEVELFVNGKSYGRIANDTTQPEKRNMIYWKDIPYNPGKVVAIARNAGKEVARHTIETTGKAVALRLEPEKLTGWKADGLDLNYVNVYAVDAKGRKVPNATGEVTFEVSGAATLIAVDNADQSSDELFGGNVRRLHNGYALAILRANQTGGAVTIKAQVAGLKGAVKTLNTVNTKE